MALLTFVGQGLRAAEVKATLNVGTVLENKFLKVVANKGEGLTEQVEIEKQKYLALKPGEGKGPTDPRYIYFDVSDDMVKALGPDCYVTVEFRDNSYGWMNLQFDATGNPYKEAMGAGNLMVASGKDRQALFVLHGVNFKGGENGAADFRLCIAGDAALQNVTVSAAGKDADRHMATIIPKIEQPLGIGKDFEVVFGGYDPSKPEDVPGLTGALESVLPLWRQLGVTSHEGYVRWNLIEREKGKYDFSVYDAYVARYQKYGIKWVPFIIIGSAYSLPDWYYNSKERVDYVCLEHNQPSDVQSLWNPALRKYVEAFLKAFAQHYGRSGVIESVILGITGNYGESIYVATGNQDWTNTTHGEYHTHGGFWCGDEFARKDYREWLKKRFENDIQKLNARWGSGFAKFDDVAPDLNAKGNQWLDFVEWYRWSMTDWAEFWVSNTRKSFPKEDLYLVTGGHMPPEHGLDISAQTKMCAKYKAGIRITNEATDYGQNFIYTHLVSSACKFYGTYFGYEPAGMVEANGIAGRNFNDTASGARHIHYYPNLVVDSAARIEAWAKSAKYLKRREPLVECAALYPFTAQTIDRQGFLLQNMAQLRDVTDFDWVDERMVHGGALEKFRVAVILDGKVYPDDVLTKTIEWVKNGGTLVVAGAAPIAALEGGDDLQKRIDAMREGDVAKIGNDFDCSKIGKGRALVFRNVAGFQFAAIAKLLYGKSPVEGFAPPRTMETDIDGCHADRVYVTYFKNSALVLNFNAGAVEKTFMAGDKEVKVKIEPYSITEISLPPPAKSSP